MPNVAHQTFQAQLLQELTLWEVKKVNDISSWSVTTLPHCERLSRISAARQKCQCVKRASARLQLLSAPTAPSAITVCTVLFVLCCCYCIVPCPSLSYTACLHSDTPFNKTTGLVNSELRPGVLITNNCCLFNKEEINRQEEQVEHFMANFGLKI